MIPANDHNLLVRLNGELPRAQSEGGEADDVLDHDTLICLGIRPVAALPLVHPVDLAHAVVPSVGVDVEQEGETPFKGGILAVRVLVTPLEDQDLLSAVRTSRVTRGLFRDGGCGRNIHNQRRVWVFFIRFQINPGGQRQNTFDFI